MVLNWLIMVNIMIIKWFLMVMIINDDSWP